MPSINKDGTPRKQGSGRPKGSSSFTTLTLEEIQRVCGGDPQKKIMVSRVWLEREGFLRAREMCKVLNSPDNLQNK